jgi:hypothetical protein
MSNLPFLDKDKKSMGAGTAQVRDPDQSNDEMLIEHVGSELMEAINRKDIKAMRDSIHALANMIKEQDMNNE